MRQEYSKDFIYESNLNSLQACFDLTITELKADPFTVYTKWYEMAKEMADQQAAVTIRALTR